MVTERRVVLIVGPPGAGKSTLALQLAATEQLAHHEAELYPDGGFRQAAADLGRDPHARAVVVRCCATLAEQHQWETLTGATETLVLDVDPEECVRRIAARRRPQWRGELQAARAWRERRTSAPLATTVREW